MTPVVLVTGASGFVGRAVMEWLTTTPWRAVPVVRVPAGLPGEIVLDLARLGHDVRTADLPSADAVVHFAARITWEGADRASLLGPNVLATGLLAEWASRCKSYFVYASTVTVCGVRAGYIRADTPANPDTAYAWSKWMGEELVVAAGGDAAVLRIAGIFGRNGPSHLGLNQVIARALAGEPPTLVAEGSAKRNYLYVHDLAEIITKCLTERVTGIHLVAGRSVLSIAEMLSTVCDILLPGSAPVRAPGSEASDQIVEPSTVLPARRTFEEALVDIRRDAAACV